MRKNMIISEISNYFMLTLLKDRVIKGCFVIKDRVMKRSFVTKDRVIRPIQAIIIKIICVKNHKNPPHFSLFFIIFAPNNN